MLGSSSGGVQFALNKGLRSESKSMLSISVFTGETEEEARKKAYTLLAKEFGLIS